MRAGRGGRGAERDRGPKVGERLCIGGGWVGEGGNRCVWGVRVGGHATS